MYNVQDSRHKHLDILRVILVAAWDHTFPMSMSACRLHCTLHPENKTVTSVSKLLSSTPGYNTIFVNLYNNSSTNLWISLKGSSGQWTHLGRYRGGRVVLTVTTVQIHVHALALSCHSSSTSRTRHHVKRSTWKNHAVIRTMRRQDQIFLSLLSKLPQRSSNCRSFVL